MSGNLVKTNKKCELNTDCEMDARCGTCDELYENGCSGGFLGVGKRHTKCVKLSMKNKKKMIAINIVYLKQVNDERKKMTSKLSEAISLINTDPKSSKRLSKKINKDFESKFNQLTRNLRRDERQIKRQDYKEIAQTREKIRTGGQRTKKNINTKICSCGSNCTCNCCKKKRSKKK